MNGLYAIKPRFQATLRPVEDWLVRRGVHPDQLTLVALGLAALAGLALLAADRQPWLLLAVPFLVLGRIVLNALDGQVARRRGLARPWGEVLNEVSDRLADLCVLGGMTLAAGVYRPVGLAALLTVLLASYVGIVGKAAGGQRQYGGVMGKADRMVLLAIVAPLGLVLDQGPLLSGCLALILAGAGLTLIQRLRSLRTELDRVPASPSGR